MCNGDGQQWPSLFFFWHTTKMQTANRFFALAWFLALAFGFENAVSAQEESSSGFFVVGGTRGTGLEIVKLLRQRGDDVTVLVRASSNTDAVELTGAQLVVGDALDRGSLDAALAQGTFRLVISSIGGRAPDGSRVDGIGNINAMEATKAAGVSRFLLISTIGTGDSYEALNLVMKVVLKSSLEAKNQAETHLIDSGLAYTIIRPGGLFDAEPSGKGILSEDPSTYGTIARSELALLALACIDDDANAGKIFSAVEDWD